MAVIIEGPDILVRLPNWLGDTVMALPALHGLRASLPRARIILVGRWASLLEGQAVADAVLPYPRDRGARSRLAAALRDSRPDTAVVWLRAWCDQGRRMGLAALEPFYKTLENWMDQIANYFAARSSNGRTEGFNHGLRAILWRGFGMLNFQHFRLRVLDRFGRPAKA